MEVYQDRYIFLLGCLELLIKQKGHRVAPNGLSFALCDFINRTYSTGSSCLQTSVGSAKRASSSYRLLN